MVNSPTPSQGDRLAEELPMAIDLSHHLSDLSKAREPSYMKSMMTKYYGNPGLVVLGGGLPHPDCFVFNSLESNVLPADAFSTVIDAPVPSMSGNSFQGNPRQVVEDHISVQKYAAVGNADINLARSMQYDMSRGIPTLQRILQELSTKFFKPAYADFTTLVHTGNTEGWARVVFTLLNPGDSLLVEDWCYTSAISTALPLGVHMVAVPVDIQGMKPDALRRILDNWDSEGRGFRRPRLLYTNPIGQNPCGYTVTGERKKQIYQVCVDFDVIITEDDPYYFLQEGAYLPKAERTSCTTEKGIDEFIATLEPSYLSFDYQGRVIRLDSFSKMLAPGLRLGWFTCGPGIAERLERQGELSTQAPCGLSQTLVSSLLVNTWGITGYVRWLQGLQAQYTTRRNAFVDLMIEAEEFEWVCLQGEGQFHGAMVYHGSLKDQGPNRRVLISFAPPTSGMFFWLKVHFDDMPLPLPVTSPGQPGDGRAEVAAAGTHEGQFWTKMVDEGLLILPGWMFRGEAECPSVDPNLFGHYRVSFADRTHEEMKKACVLLARALGKYFS